MRCMRCCVWAGMTKTLRHGQLSMSVYRRRCKAFCLVTGAFEALKLYCFFQTLSKASPRPHAKQTFPPLRSSQSVAASIFFAVDIVRHFLDAVLYNEPVV
ncbi:hypothetical protein CPC08DRAFT_330032 [Agrocybe pediades]|nr:hypothetical protein CPC08DRAFT_330032 [Agrocybe pediades]